MNLAAQATPLIAALERLGPHDHLCSIYESPEDHYAVAIPFMRIGLDRGEKCIYIADDGTVGDVRHAMESEGIDVDRASASKALVLATKEQAYLEHGSFDPDWMFSFWKEATQLAISEGFSALRATGETEWVLRGGRGLERWMEYESRLTHTLSESNCSALCQYNRRLFPPELILDVIRTHPMVIYDSAVCQNLYHVPPAEFLGTNRTAREVERLLTNIRERARVEDVLREQLTERKQAEEALRDAQAELAHVTRVMTMGELTASIAHEINQPLAAVVTNANAGLRWLAGPIPNLSEAREALARITRDGKRASDVIGRIRALVKKSSTEKAGLDLNEAIQEVVVLVQSEIQKSEVTLQMELAIDLPQILGNRVQLQQVILNLVMNGIEAMSAVTDRSRDLLIRSCKYESDKVLVAAQDSGIGIDSAESRKDLRCFLHHQVAGNGDGTWRSAARLSRVTADDCGPCRISALAQRFNLLF